MWNQIENNALILISHISCMQYTVNCEVWTLHMFDVWGDWATSNPQHHPRCMQLRIQRIHMVSASVLVWTERLFPEVAAEEIRAQTMKNLAVRLGFLSWQICCMMSQDLPLIYGKLSLATQALTPVELDAVSQSYQHNEYSNPSNLPNTFWRMYLSTTDCF